QDLASSGFSRVSTFLLSVLGFTLILSRVNPDCPICLRNASAMPLKVFGWVWSTWASVYKIRFSVTGQVNLTSASWFCLKCNAFNSFIWSWISARRARRTRLSWVGGVVHFLYEKSVEVPSTRLT